MTHEEVLALATRALDDGMPYAERVAVEEHLRGCAPCRREMAEVAAAHAALRAWGSAAAPAAPVGAASVPDAALEGIASPSFASRVGRWQATIAALFVGAVLGGAGGFTVAQGGSATPPDAPAPPITRADARVTFALFLEERADAWPPAAPVARPGYFEWLDTLVARGQYVGGERLSEDAGWYLPTNGAPVPATARTEGSANFSGLFLVRAHDYDEAVRIAAESPHLRYGGVLVRRTY